MNARKLTATTAVASLALLAVAVAPAQTFLDLSAMTSPDYYSAVPMGITAGGEVVLQSDVLPSVQYYHTYVYSGGAAGTYSDVTSTVSNTTRAVAVNQTGQIAVSASGTGSGAWLWAGGLGGAAIHLTGLTTPSGSSVAYATGIDNSGDVAGEAANPTTGEYWPYVYAAGTAYDLPVPAGIPNQQYGGSVIALSPNGAYAAGYWNYFGTNYPLAYGCACYWSRNGASWASGGTITDISKAAFGGGAVYVTSLAVAVNDSGQMVVGTGPLGSGPGGGGVGVNEATSFSIYQIGSGARTPLAGLLLAYPKADTIPNQGAFTQCINRSGQVVGYETVGSANHAAIWQDGSLIDLQTLFAPILPGGFVMNNATAISDNGYIAGYGTDAAGSAFQAFRVQLMPGDANLDGKVDINDLNRTLANYDATGKRWSDGDFNGDGRVDINDLNVVLADYDHALGPAAGPLSAVPEPGSLALALAAGLVGSLALVRRVRG